MTVRQHRLSVPAFEAEYVYPSDKDYPLNEDWEAGPVALLDTSEGLFNQAWHLTYNPNFPSGYDPDLMRYNGTTGYFSKAGLTYAGNDLATGLCRVRIASFTGGGIQRILAVAGTGGNRLFMALYASDHANVDRRDKLVCFVQDTGATVICRLISDIDVADGALHTCLFAMDAVAGTAILQIDQLDADDLGNADRLAPTTGTLPTAVGNIGVGARGDTGADKVDGDIGFVGYKDAYITDASLFMDGSQPKQLDTITWTQWGGQPALFHDVGNMVLNLGTEGAMTKNGTITQVPSDPLADERSFKVTPEDTGDPVVVLSDVNSVQCALAFDQNAHVTIAWIDSFNQGHIYWFDTTVGNWVVTDFQTPIGGIGLTLDDKRLRQTGASDVLLWYTIPVGDHHEIFTREQRNRYDEEFPMQPGLPVWAYFKKLGMHKELRVQMTMTNTGPP